MTDVEPLAAEARPEVEQTAVKPEPANDDRATVEQAKIYARGPSTEERVTAHTPATTYVRADPASAASPERERFYDVGCRGTLRSMVDHVIQAEGPIYFDVLVDRIARAHGFMRSGETVTP